MISSFLIILILLLLFIHKKYHFVLSKILNLKALKEENFIIYIFQMNINSKSKEIYLYSAFMKSPKICCETLGVKIEDEETNKNIYFISL